MNFCPFCSLDKSLIILFNDHAAAFHDGFPVTPGHALIIHSPPQRPNPGIPGTEFFP